jgi:hypothetical protein
VSFRNIPCTSFRAVEHGNVAKRAEIEQYWPKVARSMTNDPAQADISRLTPQLLTLLFGFSAPNR